jgi:MFS family permease
MTVAQAVQETVPAGGDSTVTRYAVFVLAVLVMVYGFNFMDRYIFVILMEDIKKDLSLSDTQLGLISGFAFSTVYSVAGLAVARWADRGNRRSIIAMALACWSVLTVACGLTRNFLQLVIARMGVGVSESACSPPACSLLADIFPPQRRAMAYAVYTAGLYVGLGLGFGLGGWIGEHYGWRAAFLWAGAPGILLALVVRYTIREPERGASDSTGADVASYTAREAVAYMLKRPSFVAWTGVLGATAGLTGAVASGWIADRLAAARDLRWNLWVATGGIAIVAPGTLLFLFGAPRAWLLFYFVTVFFNSFYMPPTIAITQKVMPVRMRALASAVMLLGYNFIGTAGCSFVVGVLSDLWAGSLREQSVAYALATTQLAALAGAACTIYAIVRMPRDFAEHFPGPAHGR